MTAGLGEEWVRAAALGAAIDPGNVLYAASQPKAEAPAPEAGGSDLADLLGTVPAEQPQEDSGNATAFDFTRELSLPAQGASVPDLPPLDTLPLATEESAPIDLDFALGIPPEEEPAPPPASAPAAGKLPSGPGPIDFDLGLPEEPALAEPVEAAPAPEVPEQIIAEIAAEIAADIPLLEPEQPSGPGPIEFELPELPQAMPEEPVADPAPSGGTVSGPGPIDFELPDLPLAALEEPAAEVAPKTDASSGPGPIDFDFELPEIPALAQLEESPADLPQADGADAGAMIDLDGMLADLMPTEKKPE
jgi:pilus assembly protein FimV